MSTSIPNESLSATTISRREKAERVKVQRKKTQERRELQIKVLQDIGIESSTACLNCQSKNIVCIVFPVGYKFESARHERRRLTKRSHNRCEIFEGPKDVPPEAPKRGEVKRHLFAAHTKEWYNSLPKKDQMKYKAEQIQATGNPKTNGPCQRCVTRRFPCRVLNFNSKIAEFTQPSRCALCLVDSAVHPNATSRCCTLNSDKITHAEHEADIAFGKTNPLLNWGPHGLEMTSSAQTKSAQISSASNLNILNDSFSPASSGMEDRRILRSPLLSDEVQTRLNTIYHLIDYTLNMLGGEGFIHDDCFPFSRSNIAKLDDHHRTSRGGMTAVSLLQNTFKLTTLNDIPNHFQSSCLDKLSIRTVLRAVVSRYLLEPVFLSMPDVIKRYRASLHHTQVSPEQIDDAVENLFCLQNNSSTLFVENRNRNRRGDLYFTNDNFIFKQMGEELVDIILPLVLLCGKSRQEIVDACKSPCVDIVYRASELNLIIKARPNSPVTIYSPVRGEMVSPNNARLLQNIQGGREKHGEIQMTLMLGIIGHTDNAAVSPALYVAARVELLKREKVPLEAADIRTTDGLEA
ncbi:hypothetical protein SBOR_2244 [Sclerotinia borealis F-4128]|uniref:Uncharacterized protein n=1 Tax=Sclerotinia borealis (strain F-4128) TaxID=1432307 RepID=W9CSB1_SCLBF|nr:hypothetical protein SBOR_2244 [Sclerotinia borealis F-4128]